MKVFVWEYVDRVGNSYHEGGGVVVFAETEERAREIANVDDCDIREDEHPDDVRGVSEGIEKRYIFPDAGCCVG